MEDKAAISICETDKDSRVSLLYIDLCGGYAYTWKECFILK